MEILGKLIGIVIIITCGFFTFKNVFKNRTNRQIAEDFFLAVLVTTGIFTLLPIAIAFAKALTE